MAKGNLFLGSARGKLGDVVYTVVNGVQVSRPRNRYPANPKTVGQANSRALMAPAAKFYSPLASVLETSFQGYNKSQSYTEFLRRAANDCRAGGWYLPKGTDFFPLPYMLSKGTIRSFGYHYDNDDGMLWLDDIHNATDGALDTIGGISQLFIDAGYSAGMQVTIMLVCRGIVGNYYPLTSRFNIAPESTEDPSVYMPVFNLDTEDIATGDVRLKITVKNLGSNQPVAGAVIISNFENGAWRRSTARLSVSEAIMEDLTSAASKQASIDSYRAASQEVTSDVYLNGSTGSGSSQVQVISLDDGRAVTLVSVNYGNDFVSIRCGAGRNYFVYAMVKIGADYLLTSSTKGQLPSGVQPLERWLDGTDSAIKSWLQSQGIAESVF